MIVEQVRPMAFRLTLHAIELATLISAARCVAEGRQNEMADDARQQLEQVVAGYDQQRLRLQAKPGVVTEPSSVATAR